MSEKKLCHICIKNKITHEYDKLDVCTRCLNKIKVILNESK